LIPFRFGSSGRELYAVLHLPLVEKFRGQAVLLCNPLGQEAVRVHRLYRVLAERLSKEGCSVLRFDYFGTGESDGDDTEASLSGWQADIVSADAELRQRSGAVSSTWVGARLGASIAALATTLADDKPDALVLWEPIPDGAAYVREISGPVVESARGDAGDPASPGAGDVLDVQGFRATRHFMNDVSAVGRDAVWRARSPKIAVLACDSAYDHWRVTPGHDAETTPPVEFECGVDSFDWYAEEAMDTEVVPRKVIESLMRRSLG
jgi:pimeloyl-ACP methyl ester carboxylesterase